MTLTPVLTSVLAKGRSGGGVSVHGIEDNWDAPDLTKAAFAFQIIWFIAILVEFIYILGRLSGLPSMASRGPFILLAFVTLCAAVFYLMWAISTRVDIIDTVIQAQVNSALQFLNGVQSAFLPAVILCLIHLRGGVLRASKGNTISPLASQLWKRILDWVLVALTFIFAIAQMGVIATLYAAFEDGSLTDDQSIQLFDASVALGHTFIAFQTLLYVDVIVSLIVHFIQSRRAQSSDLVTSRLLFIAAPFVAIYALEAFIADIIVAVSYDYDPLSLILAEVIIDGTCKVVIIAVLIVTMRLPNVQWTAQQTGPPIGAPVQQWPNSGWNQPNNQQQPPNAAWQQPWPNQQQGYQGQPLYQPQQPGYQQQPYYQQPQQS